MNFQKFLLLPLILFSLDAVSKTELVVWNVGQGSWATEFNSDTCVHYDMGGERSVPLKKFEICKNRLNIIALSHLDFDHISFLKSTLLFFPQKCFASTPDDPRAPRIFKSYLSIRKCEKSEMDPKISMIWDAPKNRDPNATSDVFFSKKFQTIFPGDLPKKFEKKWKDAEVSRTKILILGHHGSRTSTKISTLRKMKNLNMTIASARFIKYRHPHKDTVKILKKMNLPLLKTEDWGNIHFLSE